MKSRRIMYAAVLSLLAPFIAGVVKGQQPDLESRVKKATTGRSVRVTVKDDFSKLPLADAWVRYTNQNDTSIVYSDSTGADGTLQWDGFYTDVEPDNTNIPKGFHIEQNYPNPFNPSTTIPVSIDRYCDVNLSIYNLGGQLVRTLHDGKLNPGEHEYRWDSTNEQGMGVAAGLYIAVFRSNDNKDTIKMMLIDGNTSVTGGNAPRLAKTDWNTQTQMNPGEWYDVDISKTNYQDFNVAEFIEAGDGVLNFVYEMTRNNEAPVPIATVTPTQAIVGDTIIFDDQGSYDPDSDPFTYDWETEGTHYATPDAEHVYNTSGGKTVTLTVTDERGASRDTTFTVNVSDLEKITQGLIKSLKDGSLVDSSIVQIDTKIDTTGADGSYSIAGLEPGNYRMTVTTPGRFLTHGMNVTIADQDATKLDVNWLFPSDTTYVNRRNGSVMQLGYTFKWTEKPEIFINQDNILPGIEDKIVHYATDSTLKEVTWALFDDTADSIKYVNTSQRPAPGTEGTIVIDKVTVGNFFGFWEDPQKKGRITAAAGNLQSDDWAVVATEFYGMVTATGDYDGHLSIFNGLPTLTEPNENDKLVIKYEYIREEGTEKGDGTSDEEPQQGLGKATTSETKIYVNGAQQTLDDLIPRHRKMYEDFLKQDMKRKPDYFIILDHLDQ